MKPTVAVLYGDAGSAALINALKAWRLEYAPQASYEALLAEYINNVRIITDLVAGGRSTVLVQIQARRKRDSDHYYYEATLAAGELTLESITD